MLYYPFRTSYACSSSVFPVSQFSIEMLPSSSQLGSILLMVRHIAFVHRTVQRMVFVHPTLSKMLQYKKTKSYIQSLPY